MPTRRPRVELYRGYRIVINEKHESEEQQPFRWHITSKENRYFGDGDLGNGKAPSFEIALKHAQEKVRLEDMKDENPTKGG